MLLVAVRRLVKNEPVEVAFVVVEFRAVKFWRVVEPVCKAFEKVESPPVAVRVVPTVKVEPTARAPVVVELVEVEFPPIVSPPTMVV